MVNQQSISRRNLLCAASGAATAIPALVDAKSTRALHFATTECEIEMNIEFHDRIVSDGLRFRDRSGDQCFCVSATGQTNRNCLPDFSGSVAIARYHVRSRRNDLSLSIREYVQTIDRDNRVPARPPFERTIAFDRGVASDVQAFGLETNAPRPVVGPWCILRQDLYLSNQAALFLIVHWKHTLGAIRLLDVIPGDETRLVDPPKESRR
jgi:hypothetical protein